MNKKFLALGTKSFCNNQGFSTLEVRLPSSYRSTDFPELQETPLKYGRQSTCRYSKSSTKIPKPVDQYVGRQGLKFKRTPCPRLYVSKDFSELKRIYVVHFPSAQILSILCNIKGSLKKCFPIQAYNHVLVPLS